MRQDALASPGVGNANLTGSDQAARIVVTCDPGKLARRFSSSVAFGRTTEPSPSAVPRALLTF